MRTYFSDLVDSGTMHDLIGSVCEQFNVNLEDPVAINAPGGYISSCFISCRRRRRRNGGAGGIYPRGVCTR